MTITSSYTSTHTYTHTYTHIYIIKFILLIFVSSFSASAFSGQAGSGEPQTITADVQAGNIFPISSAISSGVIKKIHVAEGMSVKQGDLLFEFDERLINSNLEQAKAIVHMARLKVIEARKDVERSEELYERTLLSDYELQQSRVKYSETQAELAQAKNALAHAQWDKDYSKVSAPFQGRVKKILCYTGCYINNNLSTQTIMLLEKKP